MKNIITFAVTLLLAVAVIPCSARAIFDNDRPIEFKELPDAAKQFINKHFSKDKVTTIILDDDIITKEYKVVFESGAKIEFDGSGKWEDFSFYRSLGFLDFSSFACYLGADYEELFGEVDITPFAECYRASKE